MRESVNCKFTGVMKVIVTIGVKNHAVMTDLDPR